MVNVSSARSLSYTDSIMHLPKGVSPTTVLCAPSGGSNAMRYRALPNSLMRAKISDDTSEKVRLLDIDLSLSLSEGSWGGAGNDARNRQENDRFAAPLHWRICCAGCCRSSATVASPPRERR